jgi:hypothetical protein
MRGPQGGGAQFAANVLPINRDIQAADRTSLNAIAGHGGQWKHVRVRQILYRASAAAGRRPAVTSRRRLCCTALDSSDRPKRRILAGQFRRLAIRSVP